jgi:hypothetical protein
MIPQYFGDGYDIPVSVFLKDWGKPLMAGVSVVAFFWGIWAVIRETINEPCD